MRFTPDTMVDGGDVSGDITSPSQQLQQMFGFSVQAIFTGSPSGSVSLQSSLNSSDWVEIADSSTAVSSAGSVIWNVAEVNFPYLRLFWDAGGGSSGAMTVEFFGRGF